MRDGDVGYKQVDLEFIREVHNITRGSYYLEINEQYFYMTKIFKKEDLIIEDSGFTIRTELDDDEFVLNTNNLIEDMSVSIQRSHDNTGAQVEFDVDIGSFSFLLSMTVGEGLKLGSKH